MFMETRPGARTTQDRATRIETNVVPIEAPLHAQSIKLMEFWQRHCRDGRLLSRSDLPCREAAPFLPSVFVLEPMDGEGHDWRLRVVGTTLTRWLDFDPTGMTIREIYHPATVDKDAAIYRMVTRERRSHITQGRLCGVGRDFLSLEIVHLPMEGASPDEILLLGCISIFAEK
jgi:hypothetical protein